MSFIRFGFRYSHAGAVTSRSKPLSPLEWDRVLRGLQNGKRVADRKHSNNSKLAVAPCVSVMESIGKGRQSFLFTAREDIYK